VELADAVEQMWQKQRYHELFYMVDTCQSQSMFQLFYSPNILAVGSSHVGEDSLSHHVDPAIGVYIIDRYTYYALEFLESVKPDSQHTMSQFLKVYSHCFCLLLNFFSLRLWIFSCVSFLGICAAVKYVLSSFTSTCCLLDTCCVYVDFFLSVMYFFRSVISIQQSSMWMC